MKKQKSYSVPALERSIMILDALSERSLSVNDIHTELNIPKTSTFALLNILQQHQLIEKKLDGRYRIGHRTFQWGLSFYNNIDIITIARPFIKKLIENTSFTGHLAILTNNLPVYIDKVEGNGFVRFATSIGQQLPLHLSGIGKVLGINLNNQEILSAIAENDSTESEENKQKLDNYKEDIHFILKNGYAVEDEEMEDGIRCLAVPIYGPNQELLAAISITALSKDLPIIKFSEWGNKAKLTSLEISKKLEYYNDMLPIK